MPSDLQVTNIRDQANANSAITIASDGQITVNQNNPTLTLGSNATGFTGVKVVDTFWMTSDHSAHAGTDITSNWTRVNISGAGDGTNALIGGSTKMSESSGVFSFPLTGIWLINFTATLYTNGGSRQSYIQVRRSVDNGNNFSDLTLHYLSQYATGVYDTHSTLVVYDVFNTTYSGSDGVKVKFGYGNTSENTLILRGDGTRMETGVTFIRLGDT